METTTTPLAASPSAIAGLLVRSPLFQAPPWMSSSAGNGPLPYGWYTMASQD